MLLRVPEADIDKAFSSNLWKNVENANVSGGEPTTRNDLPEMVEMFARHLPPHRPAEVDGVAVRQHGTLGAAGRPAGEDDRRRVVHRGPALRS